MKDAYIAAGFPEDKIEIIPNMFDDRLIPVGHARSSPGSDTTKNILFVGRLVKDKGVDTLIEAFKGLIEDGQNVHLHIIGSGQQEQSLRYMCESAGITGNVSFHGHVSYSKIQEYYKSAALFVHPAKWDEPFGRTVLEALSFKIPTIVSDRGAPPHIVGDAGLVFKAGDSTDLRVKMDAVLNDLELYKRLSNNAGAIVAKYTPQAVAENTLDAYKRVLAH